MKKFFSSTATVALTLPLFTSSPRSVDRLIEFALAAAPHQGLCRGISSL